MSISLQNRMSLSIVDNNWFDTAQSETWAVCVCVPARLFLSRQRGGKQSDSWGRLVSLESQCEINKTKKHKSSSGEDRWESSRIREVSRSSSWISVRGKGNLHFMLLSFLVAFAQKMRSAPRAQISLRVRTEKESESERERKRKANHRRHHLIEIRILTRCRKYIDTRRSNALEKVCRLSLSLDTICYFVTEFSRVSIISSSTRLSSNMSSDDRIMGEEIDRIDHCLSVLLHWHFRQSTITLSPDLFNDRASWMTQEIWSCTNQTKAVKRREKYQHQ